MLVHTADVCGLALIVKVILLSCSPFRKTLGIFLGDSVISGMGLSLGCFIRFLFVTDVIFVINQESREISGFY